MGEKKKYLSFWQWFRQAGIQRSTAYYHLNKHLKELQEKGIVEVVYAPKSKHVFILDEERFEKFLEEKGLRIPAKM